MHKKLAEIDKLREEIALREARLKELLYPEKAVLLPADFSINDEILRILGKSKASVSADEIYRTLNKDYPKYKLDKKRVASALAYLKNKKKEIVSAGYGKYELAPKTKTTEAHDGSGS